LYKAPPCKNTFSYQSLHTQAQIKGFSYEDKSPNQPIPSYIVPELIHVVCNNYEICHISKIKHDPLIFKL